MVRITLKRARAEVGDLPFVCARCGARDARPSPVVFPYAPNSLAGDAPTGHLAAHAFPLAGFVLGAWAILHGLITGKRFTLLLPLCEGHKQTAEWISRRLPLASLVFGSVAIGLTVLWVIVVVLKVARGIEVFQWDLNSFIASLALACGCVALLLRAHCYDGFIYLLKVTEDELELGGMAEEFALELDRIDGQR